MDLLEETLKEIYPDLPNIHWINVEIASEGIGTNILRFRTANGDINTNPIIFFGFKSFEGFIRAEKDSARLLLTPGVFYIQLPNLLENIHNIIRLSQFERDKEKIKSEILEISFSGERVTRIESILAHGRGNFLGSEKLLLGAHLSGRIGYETYNNLISEIRKNQNMFLKEKADSFENHLYRLLQTGYKAQNIESIVSPQFGGTILYIDDHAHLGWGDAVSHGIWGEGIIKKENESQKVNYPSIDLIDYYIKDQKRVMQTVCFMGKGNENDFIKQLQMYIKDSILKDFNLVLLDLRLRWTEDENDDFKSLSGFKILKSIREENPAIPVIMMTASRKAKNMERVYELGADGYFIKESSNILDNETTLLYFKEFEENIYYAYSKSFLSYIWRLLHIIENSDRKLSYKINPYIKKAIAFQKKRPFKSDEVYFSLSTINEVILNIGMAWEKELDDKDYPKKNSLDRGLIITSLRNCAAHGNLQFDEEDARIVFYSFFRLIHNKIKLFNKSFSVKQYRVVLFPNLSQNIHPDKFDPLINLLNDFCKKALIELLTLNKIEYKHPLNDFSIYFETNKNRSSSLYQLIEKEKIVKEIDIRYLAILAELSSNYRITWEPDQNDLLILISAYNKISKKYSKTAIKSLIEIKLDDL